MLHLLSSLEKRDNRCQREQSCRKFQIISVQIQHISPEFKIGFAFTKCRLSEHSISSPCEKYSWDTTWVFRRDVDTQCHTYVSSYLPGKGSVLDSLASAGFTVYVWYRVHTRLWEGHLMALCLHYFPVCKIGNNNNTDQIHYLWGPQTQWQCAL